MKKYQKEKMPPEHLRKIMNLRKTSSCNSLGSMKYLPMSLYSLLSTIPMPWEETKVVKILYHINGSISFISSKPKISKYNFVNEWSKFNEVLRYFRSKPHKTMNFPIFDDEEEIFDFSRILYDRFPLEEDMEDNTNSLHRYLMEDNYNKERLMSKLKPSRVKLFNYFEIPLYKNIYSSLQIKGIRKLLKNVEENKKRKSSFTTQTNLLKHLRNTRFFQTTEMEWIEAGLIIINQGYTMLNEILKKKKLSYLYLDFNFNIKTTRPLTTKERKKSRLGTSFHLTREILKLIKYVVDAHVAFRTGVFNKYELCEGLKYLFCNVGIVTGIYRYKYRTMKQVKMCKALESISNLYQDNSWCEMWRIYVFMLRGYNSLLKNYISNLVTRMINGRDYHEIPVKKQRIESNFDIDLKRRIVDQLYQEYNKKQINMILRHFNEAWRCWKADLDYQVGNDLNSGSFDSEETDNFKYEKINKIIDFFIDVKSKWYINQVLSFKKGTKKDHRKTIGKITRLYFKEEIARQRKYLENMKLTSNEAVAIYKSVFIYFSDTGIAKIGFPERNEEKHLQNAVEKLKVGASDEEIKFYDSVLKNSSVYVYKIKKSIITQRNFREIEARVIDGYEKYFVVYNVNYLEKLTDAFVNSYLLYESDVNKMFPAYIKPADEIDIKLIYNFCNSISQYSKTDMILYEAEYTDLMKNIDNNLLSRLLKICIDPIIVDYMISRNNSTVSYKDMNFLNNLGFLRGFHFSSFIYKFYMFIVDLCVFGTDHMTKGSYISYFCRHLNRIFVLLDISESIEHKLKITFGNCEIEIDDDEDHFMGEYNRIVKLMAKIKNLITDIKSLDAYNLDVVEHDFLEYQLKVSRLLQLWKTRRKCIHLEFATRLPKNIGQLKYRNISFLNDLSFSLCKINVRLSKTQINQRSFWKLKNGYFVNMNVTKTLIKEFNHRVNQIISSSIGSTFLKTINKWNSTILGFVSHYREILVDSTDMIRAFQNAEIAIRNCIKKGINSKMPIRFPAVLFYTPRIYGGLGMYSMLDFYNEDFDKKKLGLTSVNLRIPKIIDYLKTWDEEFKISDEVWKEFSKSGVIQPEKGVPRMSTLLQKDKISFYDRGFRLVNYFKKFYTNKYDPFVYTNVRHDGKLWNLDKYFEDMIIALGGLEKILDHSLYKATYCKKFDKIFWDESYNEKYKNITKAQKQGLSQIPNRRYILWWSPTINRANVYVGYQVQLEPTGIFMHGKLPTLKVSFVQVFKNYLWRSIHASVVFDLSRFLKKISEVVNQDIPNRKSNNFTIGSPDLVLIGNFYASAGCSMADFEKDEGNRAVENVKSLWVDVQLRWGDYDRKDSSKYAKVKYMEYTSNPLSKYPDKKGIIVVLDLCYNTYSFFGYLDKKICENLKKGLEMVVSNNLSLHILRGRLRKTLGIYNTEIENISNGKELFFDSIIVDERPLFTSKRIFIVLEPDTGNVYTKRVPEEEGRKPKNLRNCIANDIFKLALNLKKQNILIRFDMSDAMESYHGDFSSISLKTYDCNLPLINAIQIENLNISNETEFFIFNTYKNWFGTSKFTNFCRLLLILRVYSINKIKLEEYNLTKMWPIYKDEEWISIEKELKDEIINDYCSLKVLNPKALTLTDIRDIVFGFEVEIKEKKHHEVPVNLSINWKLNYFSALSELENFWSSGLSKEKIKFKRFEFLEDYTLRNQHLSKVSDLTIYKIPLNIFTIFKRTIDFMSLCFCLLIDSDPISASFIPQFSTEETIHSPSYLPKEYKHIGILINTENKRIILELIERYKIIDPLVIIFKDEILINKSFDISKVDGKIFTCEYWNYNFAKKFFYDDLEYSYILEKPLNYFNGHHRISHFSDFYYNHRQ